jgi:general secretion pathway protein H
MRLYLAKYRQRGFTLVEIMAVVFIIGVMISLVAIRVDGLPERRLGVEAQRIFQKIRLLIDEAEFSGSEMGFALTDDGYELFRFNDPTLSWISFTEGNFKPTVLDSHYALELRLNDKKPDTEILYKKERREKARDYGEKKHDEPEIMFFSDGQITPFELTMTDKNIPKLHYVVTGLSSGKLDIQFHEK